MMSLLNLWVALNKVIWIEMNESGSVNDCSSLLHNCRWCLCHLICQKTYTASLYFEKCFQLLNSVSSQFTQNNALQPRNNQIPVWWHHLCPSAFPAVFVWANDKCPQWEMNGLLSQVIMRLLVRTRSAFISHD